MFNLKPTRGFGLLENFLAHQRTKMANKLIPISLREGRVLDIGCGTIPTFLLKVQFKEKFGLDSSLKKDEYNENINLALFDIKKGEPLPFNDDFFNVVVMLAVLEHLESDKVEFILGEVKRVLKKGGRFILTTPSPWADGLLKLMSKLRLVSPDEIKDHKGKDNYYRIMDNLQRIGFKQADIRKGSFEFFLNNWVYADKSY